MCNATLPLALSLHPAPEILNSRLTDLGPRQRECVFCSLTEPANTKSKRNDRRETPMKRRRVDRYGNVLERHSVDVGAMNLSVSVFISNFFSYFIPLFFCRVSVCFHLLPPMALPLLYSVTLIVQYNARYPSLYLLGSRDRLHLVEICRFSWHFGHQSIVFWTVVLVD